MFLLEIFIKIQITNFKRNVSANDYEVNKLKTSKATSFETEMGIIGVQIIPQA